jgi:large subunit ribosomal protein L12e
MAKEFSGTVKEILGTAKSIGCTVEGSDPNDVLARVDEGEFDAKFEGRK